MPTPSSPVQSLSPTTIEGVFDGLLNAGRAAGHESSALDTVVALRERFFAAAEFVNAFDDGPLVAVLTSVQPFVVGGDWIPQLVERAGGQHPLNPTIPRPGAGAAAGPQMAERIAGAARAVTASELAESDPQWLVLSLAGVSLEDARAIASQLARESWWRQLRAYQHRRVLVVEGDHSFNTPGPCLAAAFEFLVGHLQGRPQIIPASFHWSQGAP